MILIFFLNLIINLDIKEEVGIENIIGNWERVCLENDALGFQVEHCNFFGDREMQINEWNYIEMIFKNGERNYYDFKLEGDKIDIYHRYKQVVKSSIILEGDTLIIESNEIYNELMNRKFEANYNRVFFVRSN